MKKPKRSSLLNIAGGCIVALWLVMMGLLVKKVHFEEPAPATATENIAQTSPSIGSLQREWMGIYLGDKKVGYSYREVDPLEQGYLIQDKIMLKLNLLGQQGTIKAVTRAKVGPEFLLEEFSFRMTSGVVTYQVKGEVEGERIVLEIGKGPSGRREVVPVSTRPVIGASLSQFFKGRDLKVGQSFEFPLFDPSAMVEENIAIRVEALEELVIRGIEYEVFRLETELWGHSMTFWLDKKGNVLKQEGFMGLTLVKSNASLAPEGIEAEGGEDFYDVAAVGVKRRIKHPEGVSRLKLKVRGIEGTGFSKDSLNRGRQNFRENILEIEREELPRKMDSTLPYTEEVEKEEGYLKPEALVQSDHALIREKAKEIRGGSTDPLSVSRKMMKWVYRNVKKRPVMAVPSALDVLKNKVGDCNEHSVLLTALLRASGIPSRICVGLVYRRGKFYYHAWNECYVGEWITLDATLDQMPVDATHIKLVQGGLDKQVRIISLIGKLQLEVIDYGYD